MTREHTARVAVTGDAVTVRRGDAPHDTVPRTDTPSADIETVLHLVGDAMRVAIDDPSGDLVDELTNRLRRRCVDVHRVGSQESEPEQPRRRKCLAPTGIGVASVAVMALVGAVTSVGDAPAAPRTWLVEGRITVEVPAGWRTERITGGPGAARVQVTSPTDPAVALHVTQSPIPAGQPLPVAADVVRAALDEQPDGVFSDFQPATTVAERPAIVYRESRPDRRIDWTLVLTTRTRIAIGCQGAGEDCVHAVRTAREVVP
ncbi:type VII secretion-associated protein [Mycolicibacterium grossiae]|nr:type VII secretion-associated protein [Mycolicibacterium grossiae]QEM45355.1 type VII secretion-associated protein [Mycolicibacterium grossiae]